MQITGSIDWYAGTGDIIEFPPGLPVATIKTVPQKGYTTARQYVPDGRRVSSNQVRADMPDHLTYSGQTLAWLHDIVPATKLIEWHETGMSVSAENSEYWRTLNREPKAWKCTRIDLAVDVRGANFNINRLYSHFKQGKVITRAKDAAMLQSASGGKTLYIGNRTSELFLRIYDKAAEQGVGGDWKRIEIEVKGYRAKMLSKQLSLAERPMEIITGTIAAYCMFPEYKTYVRALNEGKTANIIPGQSEKRKTREWLLTQVVSAIVRVYREGDEEIMTDILSEVRKGVSAIQR